MRVHSWMASSAAVLVGWRVSGPKRWCWSWGCLLSWLWPWLRRTAKMACATRRRARCRACYWCRRSREACSRVPTSQTLLQFWMRCKHWGRRWIPFCPLFRTFQRRQDNWDGWLLGWKSDEFKGCYRWHFTCLTFDIWNHLTRLPEQPTELAFHFFVNVTCGCGVLLPFQSCQFADVHM